MASFEALWGARPGWGSGATRRGSARPHPRHPGREESLQRRKLCFFSRRRRHTRCSRDWSSDVCSSDLGGGSRYSRDSSSKFEKDRTPIHSRDSFRKNEYQSKNIVYQKKTRDYNSNESDEFYSTLRTKLFKILGGKK